MVQPPIRVRAAGGIDHEVPVELRLSEGVGPERSYRRSKRHWKRRGSQAGVGSGAER